MSTPQAPAQPRLDSAENLKLLLNEWGDSLVQVFESMTDRRPPTLGQETMTCPATQRPTRAERRCGVGT